MGAFVVDHPRERVLEQIELVLTADEWRGNRYDATVGLEKLDEPPRDQGLAEPLQVDRPDLFGFDGADRQPACERSDQDLARLSLLLQTRRDVDGLAGGEGRVALVGDDLARLDTDPGLEAEAVYRIEDGSRRANRALGVVLVGLRNAERGHDGVAGELLHDSAVRRDAVRDVLEERVDAAADDLGVACSDQLRRADEVHEQDGGELAFHSLIVVT